MLKPGKRGITSIPGPIGQKNETLDPSFAKVLCHRIRCISGGLGGHEPFAGQSKRIMRLLQRKLQSAEYARPKLLHAGRHDRVSLLALRAGSDRFAQAWFRHGDPLRRRILHRSNVSVLSRFHDWVWQRQREALLVAIASALLVRTAWVVIQRWVPTETPRAASERILGQFVTRHTDGLRNDLMPFEWELSGLNGSRFVGLCEWIEESFRGYRPEGKVEVEADNNSALAIQTMKDRQGHEVQLDVCVYQTQDGPKLFLLETILSSLQARMPEGDPSDSLEVRARKSLARSIRVNVPQLRQFAPNGICQSDPTKVMLMSWDKWEASLERTAIRAAEVQLRERDAATERGLKP